MERMGYFKPLVPNATFRRQPGNHIQLALVTGKHQAALTIVSRHRDPIFRRLQPGQCSRLVHLHSQHATLPGKLLHQAPTRCDQLQPVFQ
ncbi:MAG: hypothetical protein BWY82_02185 [Verrucomicrobia bacterium ADurb.Bin474]|nr:MAG: hypothetical protein BWY82_02185 [Verrucomicrobia bacterium ADurb.Bin474]